MVASEPTLTPEQEQELKEWIADARQWISRDKAVEVIKTRLAVTTGYAQKLLTDARASGEVRYANDDGVLQRPCYDYTYRKDDLEGWLDRRLDRKFGNPQKNSRQQHRYAGDDALIEEGRRMIESGVVSSKRKAAEKLADKAEGSSYEQKVERLRKLI